MPTFVVRRGGAAGKGAEINGTLNGIIALHTSRAANRFGNKMAERAGFYFEVAATHYYYGTCVHEHQVDLGLRLIKADRSLSGLLICDHLDCPIGTINFCG